MLVCFRCCIKAGKKRKDCWCGSSSSGHCFINTLSRTVAHDRCACRQCFGWLGRSPSMPSLSAITVGELTHIQGSCAPDITNHTKRHKNYKLFWKSLKDRGLWQHEVYINRKTSAGLSEVELRELMPQCVLDDTRKRYPNPPGGLGYRFLVSSRTHWGISSRNSTSLSPAEVFLLMYPSCCHKPLSFRLFQNSL